METLNSASLTNNQIMAAANKDSLSDALSDPLADVVTEIVDEMADLAKERLRKLHGLPAEEPKPLPPLLENCVLRQAKTAEELGLDESTLTAWTPAMDAKVPSVDARTADKDLHLA